jgi:4a-hydroxytetrahydrobiopterin dehydratase
MHAEQALAPCPRGTPPLALAECHARLAALPGWRCVDVGGIAQLERAYEVSNFVAALGFATAIGALAEAADHHPAITVEWGKVTLRWWTHGISGLHHNDFVMAARCDAAFLQHVSAGAAR